MISIWYYDKNIKIITGNLTGNLTGKQTLK